MKPIGHAVPAALAALLQPMALSPGKVEFAWKAAVGPALERTTLVRLEGSALIVQATDAHWAQAVSQSSIIILSRLESLLGHGVVKNLIVRSA
jgi:hypothetical protein